MPLFATAPAAASGRESPSRLALWRRLLPVLLVALAAGLALCTTPATARTLRQQQQPAASAPAGTALFPHCQAGVGKSAECLIVSCSRWPCAEGWQETQDLCACRCLCAPPLPPPAVGSNTTNVSNAAANAALDAEEQELAALPRLPGQQLAQRGACAVAFQACTCSAQCCSGLVCGFPTLGAASRRAEAAATAAAAAAAANRTAANGTRRGLNQPGDLIEAPSVDSVNATGQQRTRAANATNSSSAAPLSLNGSSNGTAQAGRNATSAPLPLALADTGGPSCRLLAQVDLQTGVVEYGCG